MVGRNRKVVCRAVLFSSWLCGQFCFFVLKGFENIKFVEKMLAVYFAGHKIHFNNLFNWHDRKWVSGFIVVEQIWVATSWKEKKNVVVRLHHLRSTVWESRLLTLVPKCLYLKACTVLLLVDIANILAIIAGFYHNHYYHYCYYFCHQYLTS